MTTLNLSQKIAQLFLVGSDTANPEEELEPFYASGLGGLLLFRHHLQPFETAGELREQVANWRRCFGGPGLSFIGIDQEGGQVERLPHWLFPTGLLPVVFGLKRDEAFCEQVNRETARRLRWLGINLNFTPTVDLNRELMNPIIGVRAYGTDPEPVTAFARRVCTAYEEAGVLPVAKHFPGHGTGTVDSHIGLPVFESWTEAELQPYAQLIQSGLPAVLVAHGLYPKLAKQLGSDLDQPASLSSGMMTRLLRDKMGFNGLVFTDDLMMGALQDWADPVEVALQALEAGADMLVYRRALPEAWTAFEALVARVRQGKLSEALIDDKVSRILAARHACEQKPVYSYTEQHFDREACHELALHWAKQGMEELHHDFISPLPFSRQTRWALVAPDRQTMIHYAPDAKSGRDLLGYCKEYGVPPVVSFEYPAREAFSVESCDGWKVKALDALVFVAFNSVLNPSQQALYTRLRARFPEAKIILASSGMPTDRDVLPRPWVHIQLPGFRPAHLQALVQWLTTSPVRSTAG